MARVEQSYGEHTKAIDKNGKYTSAEIPYIVFEAADEDAALAAVLAAAPKSCNDLPLDSIEIDSRENETTFKVNAVYKSGTASSSSSDSNEAQMSFDLSTGSETVKRTMNQRWKSANARATGGYIGWNGQPGGDIAGVTVVSGVMRETYTLYWKPSKLDNDYRRILAGQVGRVNSKSFKGWYKGEALFLGASFSGNASGSEKVAVTYNFAIQQNEAATSVDGVAVPAKYGWEYVWSIAETKADGKVPVVVVDGIYFEQVYKWGDFGRLKI